MDTEKTKPLHWLFKLVIAGSVILLLCIMFTEAFVDPVIGRFFSRRDFVSEQWKNWKETESTMFLRRDMVHDLTKQHNFVGMSRSEVIDLLGQPSREYAKSISYSLGPTGGFGISYGSLNITINENGIVEKYDVHEH